jgi:cell division protein FtsW (lipid II flippase)
VFAQVAMYERTHHFVHGFGVIFQDCTGKTPSRAIRRQSPWILVYNTLWFVHKVVLAYVFGAFANEAKSWPQIGILVRCHRRLHIACIRSVAF